MSSKPPLNVSGVGGWDEMIWKGGVVAVIVLKKHHPTFWRLPLPNNISRISLVFHGAICQFSLVSCSIR